MKAFIIAMALAAGLMAGPAGAGPLSDLIMAPGVLAQAPAGPVFHYAHSRHLPGHPAGTAPPQPAGGMAPPKPVVDGTLTLTAGPGDHGPQLVLTRTEAGETHPVATFPAAGPNPVLLFFLENTVRVMATETGGSPFYIRNRIRAALADAGAGATEGEVLLHPFETDPNRARMGDFATLALHLAFDPARPGRLVELKADTAAGPAGYTETLALQAEE
ncbi:MAG: hypothetical protein QM656_16685 [Paracoccaceae bacterium]